MAKKRAKTHSILNRALICQRKGRFKEAADIYRQILLTSPNQPDALHFLGMLAHQTGQLGEAVQLIAQSLRVNPNNAGALSNLAGVLKDQRRFEEALQFYRAALAATPGDARVHSNLGNLFAEMGRLDEAAACHIRAVELDPKFAAAHCNLGSVLQSQNRTGEAVECYRMAIALDPQAHQAWSNLGSALNVLGRFSEAVDCHESALKIEPNSDTAWVNFAAALRELGRLPEAIDCCWRALKINPRSHLALNNLGTVLKEQGRLAEAAACLRKALELKPDSHLVCNNLGNVLAEQGLPVEGMAFLRKALELNPLCQQTHRNLGSALYGAGRAKDAVACFRKALELKPDSSGTFSDLLFALNYLRQDGPAALFAEHVRFGEQFGGPPASRTTAHCNTPDPDRLLRVGFVSGDLCEHPVANFIEPVFSTYSRQEFEIFCYANQPVNDAVSERLRRKVDAWHNVNRLSDDELADLIRRDGIDILVDLSGHTARNRLLVFARKPAPVQVTMIGYMQTTGLAAMDYRITDEVLDPPGASEHFNTEKLVRLPAGAAPFQPPADCPPVNELPALKNGHVTFASFNNLAKVTPEVLTTWADVLKAAPGSRLLVVGRGSDAIAAIMESHGIAPERLELLERKPMKEYLALHNRVDFMLDAFPYNGGTTNLIAAWMGVPFVTIEGCSTISRVGAGILKAAGLPELIATDTGEYVRKAAAAVRDLPQLAGWRQALRPRLAPRLCDGSIFTRQLEQAFREMWRRWCASRPGVRNELAAEEAVSRESFAA